MTKVLFLLIVLFSFTCGFGQSSPIPDYLSKSKKQRTCAKVLLWSGLAVFTTGGIVATSGLGEPVDPSRSDDNEGLGIALLCIGGASMAASIPLFISASQNKKKAKNVSTYFRMEKIPFLQHQAYGYRLVPAVAVKLNL